MKCEEATALQSAYLDSELDPKTTLQVNEHLKTCSECARVFAEEEKLDSWLKTTLRTGTRSADFWAGVEASVHRAGRSKVVPKPASLRGSSLLERLLNPVEAARRLTAGKRSRLAWLGLAAAWSVILLLSITSRENTETWIARQATPSSGALRVALKQRQKLMADLALFGERPAAAVSKTAPAGSRSELQKGTLNS